MPEIALAQNENGKSSGKNFPESQHFRALQDVVSYPIRRSEPQKSAVFGDIAGESVSFRANRLEARGKKIAALPPTFVERGA